MAVFHLNAWSALYSCKRRSKCQIHIQRSITVMAMDFNVAEIISLLCKLADSENLRVALNENSRFLSGEISRTELKELSKIPLEEHEIPEEDHQEGYIELEKENEHSSATDDTTSWLQRISVISIFGFIFTGIKAVFSRTWNYVFGNYQMSVNVRVVPVSTILRAIPRIEQCILAHKIRQIKEQNFITSYEALAAEIEQDSSLVREIILKHLGELSLKVSLHV